MPLDKLSAAPGLRIGPSEPAHLIVFLTHPSSMDGELTLAAQGLVSRVPDTAALILSGTESGARGDYGWAPTMRGFERKSEGEQIADVASRLWPRIAAAIAAEGLEPGQFSLAGFDKAAAVVLALAARGRSFAGGLAFGAGWSGEISGPRSGSPSLFMAGDASDHLEAQHWRTLTAERFVRRGYEVVLWPDPQTGPQPGETQISHAASFLRGVLVTRPGA